MTPCMNPIFAELETSVFEVMSRLARARAQLKELLADTNGTEGQHAM